MSSRLRFPLAYHTPKKQTSNIRSQDPVWGKQNHHRWGGIDLRNRFQKLFLLSSPLAARGSRVVVEGKSLKAGDRKTRNQTSKLGQQRQKLDLRGGAGS